MCDSVTDDLWAHPCEYHPKGTPPKQMNLTNVSAVLTNAKSSLISAKALKEDFSDKTNNPGKKWGKLDRYGWLPNVPYTTDIDQMQEHLSSLKWQNILPELYKYWQIMGVAIDQVIKDIEDKRNRNNEVYEPLQKNFTDLRGFVTNMLVELMEVIIDNKIPFKTDITPATMPGEHKGLVDNLTSRSLRDWIILREMVNMFDYTYTVLHHLSRNRSEDNSD